jgi:hypothetical protein
VLKHPNILAQTKRKFFSAQMATLRALEKMVNDIKVAANLVMTFTIAGVEDIMAAANEKNEQNAAHPASDDIS